MHTIVRTLGAVGIVSALCAHASPPAKTDEARVWRLAVADAKTPTIRIWDVEEREEVAVLTTHSPARLRPGLSDMEAVVVQGKSGAVQMLHLGLKREDHGDHQHWITAKPELSAPISSGQKPSHANPGSGKLAIFYDGEGLARIYNPTAPNETTAIKANAAHHGLAVPLPRQRFLVTVGAPEGSLPEATQLVDASNTLLQRSPPCVKQHGDASFGAWHVFGCANGLLVWDDAAQQGHGAFTLLPYPAGSDSRMVRTLLQARGEGRFVGNFGADGLLFIRLQPHNAAPLLASVTLPAKLLHFAWDDQDPHTTFALLETGIVVALDSSTQRVLRQTSVIPPWKDDATDADKRLPKPQLAVAEGRMVISDARTGLVHVLRTQDLKETDQLKVGGQPSGLLMRSVDLSAD
jgi:hypothetical protein